MAMYMAAETASIFWLSLMLHRTHYKISNFL